MRALDKIRQKRRFLMFNEDSKEKVLELNSFFGKYLMHFEEKIKKTFVYYDTPDHDLEKSNIVLYKTSIGNFTELNMATETVTTNVRYKLRTNYRHYTKQIRPHDSILKHKDFLVDNFTNMFMSSINFDPEFLMRKLQVAYVIQTVSKEYRSMNVTGLKITYSFDKDRYTNNYNHQQVETNILTIYQHSSEKTDEDFEDLISKLTRYCKELTPTNDTKIMIARAKTLEKEKSFQQEMKAREEKKLADKKDKKKK